MNSTTGVVESQVDWLTATASSTNSPFLLGSLGEQLCRRQETAGDKRRSWDWRQYVGEICGPVRWGSREDGNILQISGPTAALYFDDVYPLASNVTRIDLQVTWRAPDGAPDYGERGYDDLDHYNPQHGSKPKGTHYRSSDGGSTLYVGSRASVAMGRVYNKEAESGDEHYVNCWRWELECKAEFAVTVAKRLVGSGGYSEWIAGTVRQWFSERGIAVPWPATGVHVATALARSPRDVDRSLVWLGGQVSPTVSYLVGRGYGARVIQALGLQMFLDTANATWYNDGTGSHAPS